MQHTGGDETAQAGLITPDKKPAGKLTGGFLLERVGLWYNKDNSYRSHRKDEA